MKTITKQKAKELINKYGDKIFCVEFIKKNGEHRLMNARLKVKKGVKNVGMRYKASEYDLLIAYDMRKNGFRMININTLLALSINKNKYIIYNNK